jgi:hypothetical protein
LPKWLGRHSNRRILQVLLLREEEVTLELAPVLWAMLQEVEALYVSAGLGRFESVYLGRGSPPGAPPDAELPPQEIWEGIRGTRPVKHEEIARRTRAALGRRADRSIVVVVTDQEIVPPRDWRYVISDGDDEASVVSIAPTDPRYWGEEDPDRLKTIKYRAQAACCGVVGEYLGLKGCTNSWCFLYRPVDSVVQLDEMLYFGPEHGPRLDAVGFISASDPAAVEGPGRLPNGRDGRAG